MSPRSDELIEAVRRRLAAASVVIDQDPSAALSAAYYAMLYAARAALSERDVTAKTHRGIWHELRRVFVDTGELNADLASAVQKIQPSASRPTMTLGLLPPLTPTTPSNWRTGSLPRSRS